MSCGFSCSIFLVTSQLCQTLSETFKELKELMRQKKINGSGRFSSKHFQRDETVLVNIRGI